MDSIVHTGALLESDEWPGRLGTYTVDFYLTGPVGKNTTRDLRYGYVLSLGVGKAERIGFASVEQAENHARLVMRRHDNEVSCMSSPF